VERLLFLQRHAGNAAVGRMLVQRKSPRPKPPLGLREQVEALERAVVDGSTAEGIPIAKAIHDADPGLYIDLVLHDLHTHEGQRRGWGAVSPGSSFAKSVPQLANASPLVVLGRPNSAAIGAPCVREVLGSRTPDNVDLVLGPALRPVERWRRGSRYPAPT
jgi:hypothetical protein